MFDITSNNDNLINSIDIILKFLGGVGAFYIFIIGLNRYQKDQIWKRNEFIAERAKEFNSDIFVRNVLNILDWDERYILLFPDNPIEKHRYTKVTRMILKSALLSQNHKLKYNKVEVAIRDNFDCFLNYFEVFDQYIEAGIVTSKELEPYLKYWINKISEGIEKDTKNSICLYIEEHGYTGTQNIFKKFGKDIFPKNQLG